MSTTELSDRRARLDTLKTSGHDPYVATTARTHMCVQARALFDSLQESGNEFTIAGRVMSKRDIGALTFLRIMDESGTLQAVLREEDLGGRYAEVLDVLDTGDFVQITGTAYVTKTGEQSILTSSAHIVTKALRPLPEKWHGLQDVETRFRQRELDLLSNPSIRHNFVVRSKMVSAMRRFLDEAGFLEVETPMLQPIPGGASARPFITHHNALNTDFYMRIAPELYLKRLLVGGFEKIYEIGRCFRNEGIDYAHNPEFTMLEMYWAYVQPETYVSFLEDMLRTAIVSAKGNGIAEIDDISIDFSAPWPRTTFREAVLNACGIDIDLCTNVKELIAAVKEKKIKVDFKGCVGLGEHLDALYKNTARSKMVGPVWVYDYPVDLKPLTRVSPNDATKSACVQLVVLGSEIVNAYYHELNDPIEQRARLEEQQKLRDAGSDEAQWLDEAFLQALETGMPPASGVGIGIDRLAAIITGTHSLKEIILFPTLRPKNT